MSQQTRIVVLGGGYAGLMAAERLAKNTDPNTAITLINDRDMFLERVRNHQRLAGEPVRSLSLSSFLAGTRIRLLVGVVSRLAPARRQLTLETANGSMTIDYDHLVYALGSAVATSDVPGVREHASTLDYAPTLSLARRLPALAALGGRLLVVGGGNTGVEVSTELAEAYPTLKITLVTRRSFARQLSNGARTFDGRSTGLASPSSKTRRSPRCARDVRSPRAAGQVRYAEAPHPHAHIEWDRVAARGSRSTRAARFWSTGRCDPSRIPRSMPSGTPPRRSMSRARPFAWAPAPRS